MYKAYKFRLYPNKHQLQEINKTLNGVRYVYNYYLKMMIENGHRPPKENIKDYEQKLKYKQTYLQTIDTKIIIKTIYNIEDNIKKISSTEIIYPKYKSQNHKISYTIKALNINNESNIKLDLQKSEIFIPNLNILKIRGYKTLDRINGKLMSATISKDQTGKFYISLLYNEIDNVGSAKPTSIVGIDLGIKHLITLSDGTIYENNKYIEKYEKRIKRLQKELSRKTPYSNNYYKCKKRIQKVYSKLNNARKYYIHEITKEITDNYDIIICEKLNIREMIEKSNNPKHLLDASLYEILNQLDYKCRFKQKHFIQIDTYYPSSQKCSVCSNIDKTYKNLDERIYKCHHCNNELDRDLNASINIMFEGLKLYMNKISK